MNGNYENLISNASTEMAASILSQEADLVERALGLDIEVREVLRQIGLRAMEKVFGALAQEVSNEVEGSGIKLLSYLW